MKTQTKDIWLEEGLKILEESGPGALTIENLVANSGKTKGSFYHHFKNRNHYIEALLSYFETKGTLDIIYEVGKETDQTSRKKKLTKLVFQNSSRLELVIRSWALYEPVVKAFQDRIDQKRLDHIKSIYVLSSGGESKAQITALRNYAIYIGLQQLKHLCTEKELRQLIKNFFSD